MRQKTFSLISGIFFLVITLLHIARLLFGWQVSIGDAVAPMWVSWIAIVIGAYLSYQGLKLSRSSE